MTIDSRTLTTNYNVANNSTGANELWLRSGFEWTPLNNVTVKDQVYYFQAQRHWIDSETYAFDDGAVFAPNTIDRDRFFVTHNQHVVGNNLDFLWDSRLFGMDNRLAAQLQVSGDWITFTEEGNPNDYPYDNVSVIDPAPGRLRPEVSGYPEQSSSMTLPLALEDRLKITPEFALIGGIRVDDWTLKSNGTDFDGSIPAGEPFTQVWKPVSYRAAYTYEPIQNGLLRHVRYILRSGRRRRLFRQRLGAAGIDERANLRNRRQATVLGQQGRVDVRRLRHHPAQRLCADH